MPKRTAKKGRRASRAYKLRVALCRSNIRPPCQHVTDLIDQHLTQVEQRIAELAQTRTALRELHKRAATTDPAECTRPAVCTILTPAKSAPTG
jgi:DNA-binding transcriptional MerR regulator